MSNTFFHFKQFSIHQDRCAMKVGTDGVLLGAWVRLDGVKRILDIGTGTGLIALMLAQRSMAMIDAIEIDTDAAAQASENFQKSAWKDRISVHNTSLQSYIHEDRIYDLIVTNPPYFANSLPAPDPSRNMARHNFQLSTNDLLEKALQLLTPVGRLGIILPFDGFGAFTDEASEKMLFPVRMTLVKPSSEKPVKRVMAEFSFNKEIPVTSDLILEKGGRHDYSEAYINLTRDFYLHF
jgi:tRNA1Val (adenine37-N6)-methyltransferase